MRWPLVHIGRRQVDAAAGSGGAWPRPQFVRRARVRGCPLALESLLPAQLHFPGGSGGVSIPASGAASASASRCSPAADGGWPAFDADGFSDTVHPPVAGRGSPRGVQAFSVIPSPAPELPGKGSEASVRLPASGDRPQSQGLEQGPEVFQPSFFGLGRRVGVGRRMRSRRGPQAPRASIRLRNQDVAVEAASAPSRNRERSRARARLDFAQALAGPQSFSGRRLIEPPPAGRSRSTRRRRSGAGPPHRGENGALA